MIFGGLRRKILENNVKNNRLSKIKKNQNGEFEGSHKDGWKQYFYPSVYQ